MKRIFLLFVGIIFFSITSQGQISKGYWMAGGKAAFSASNTHSSLGSVNQIKLSVSPDVGYFIINKLALGVDGDFEHSNYKALGGPRTIQYNFALGPFIRYYLLPTDNIVNLLLGSSFTHNISKPGNSYTNSYSFFAGPTAFFNSSVAIEATAGFSSLITKHYTTNSFVVNIGFQIYLISNKN